jgi:uncharacterized protein (DUF2345 family)
VATQLQVQHAEIAGKADITTANNPGEAEKQEKNERNDKKFPELKAPHLVLSSPVGIESSTAQSTHQHSGQHHAVTTGGHISLSAGKSVLASAKEAIKLFAYRSGMRLVSAVADIDIQALQQSIQILAKLNIRQEANRITLTAREEIVINGGGSFKRWNAQGITEGTTGTWVVRASHHSMPAQGKSLLIDKRQLPAVMPLPSMNIGLRLDSSALQQSRSWMPGLESVTHLASYDKTEQLANIAGLDVLSAPVFHNAESDAPLVTQVSPEGWAWEEEA